LWDAFCLPGKIAARPVPAVSRVLIGVLILALLIVAARGSIGRRPAQRKDAGITKDAFLNKAVVNPYFHCSLLYRTMCCRPVWRDWKIFTDNNVRAAAQELFNDRRSFDDLDAYLEKHAKGPRNMQPRHVFLVVMESFDTWPFITKYSSLGLTETALPSREERHLFRKLRAASDGTMQSLTAIMTSILFSR